MVLGKVAIRDNLTYVLPVLRSLLTTVLWPCHGWGLSCRFSTRGGLFSIPGSACGIFTPLIQVNPAHFLTPCFVSTYHTRIMHPSLPRSLAWPFPWGFLLSFCMHFTSAMHVLVRQSHPFRFVRPSNAEWAKSYLAALTKYCWSLSTVRSHDMGKIRCCFSRWLSGYIVLSSFWCLLV